MGMKTFFFLTLEALSWFFTTNGFAVKLNKLSWMSEQFPPYNWQEAGKPGQGIAVEILNEVIKDMGDQLDLNEIKFLPWARSYSILQTKRQTALFSMTWTKERSKIFNLVGPMIPVVVAIISRADSDFPPDDKNFVKNLSIGVVREDVGDQLMLSAGIKDKRPDNYTGNDVRFAEPSNGVDQLIMKLANNRIKGIAYNIDTAQWVLKKMKAEGKIAKDIKFKAIYTLSESYMTYAFHKDVDPHLIKVFKASLEKLRSSGKIEVIRKKYLE